MQYFDSAPMFLLLANRLLHAVIAGLLLGVALLVPAYAWPLVIIGSALAFFVFKQSPSWRTAFWFGWLMFGVKAAVSLVWFWSAYPLDWLGISSGVLQFLAIALYWVPAAVTLGFGGGIVGALLWFVFRRLSRWWEACAVFVLWPIGEVLGALTFSVYTLGPGSSITPAFSFGFTGYALTAHNILFTMFGVGGVVILSGLVAVLGWILFVLATTYRWQYAVVALIVLVLTGFVPLPKYTGERIGHTVAVVETDFTLTRDAYTFGSPERTAVYAGAITAAANAGAQTVILPEDGRFSSAFRTHDDVLAYINIVSESPVTVIDSSRSDWSGRTHLVAYVYDTKRDVVHTTEKQYLVPQGEYIPYIYDLLIRLLLPADVYTQVTHDTSYVPGQDPSTSTLPSDVPAVLFCSESVDPLGVQKWRVANNELPFMAHIVSHSWFHRDPVVLWNQLDSMLKVQARANGIALAMAANEATAAIYLPNGKKIVPPAIADGGKWRVRTYEF